MDRVAVTKHRREVMADGPDFLVANVHVEDLGQDLELPFACQLLIVEVLLVDYDGVLSGKLNFRANAFLNIRFHLKISLQWKWIEEDVFKVFSLLLSAA